MPRSKEALARRAAKRSVPVTQQMKADSVKRRKLNNSNDNFAHDKAKMQEAGAWTCPTCGNNNFASRRRCNSKMCDTERPTEATKAAEAANKGQRIVPRHLPMMAGKWPEQKSKEGIEFQQYLRKCYRGEDGFDPTDLTVEESKRAKVLVERDQRKNDKKEKNKARRGKMTERKIQKEDMKQKMKRAVEATTAKRRKKKDSPEAVAEKKHTEESSSSCPSSSSSSSSSIMSSDSDSSSSDSD